MKAPPGRAGRLWLLRRLEVARRGTGVLEQKRQTLLRERERTARALADATSAWEEHARAAAAANDRALALAGARRLRLAAQPVAGTATAEVRWRNALGTLIPHEVLVAHGEPSGVPSGGAPAVALSAVAHRAALDAAAEYAVARAAHEAIERELAATARRLRAIERRWIPDHEAALRRLELALEEHELEDAVRSRFALEKS
ncbi:MAG: V-type ATPase, D subunit [Thermoleophilia bacterium]|nr:V-type ATPase, D subunit [Thermoleophilia bacterium]